MRLLQPLRLVLLLCLVLFCFSSCTAEKTPMARVGTLASSSLSLPPYTIYDSTADKSADTYMPEGMGHTLYDIMGYSELRHAESYAICLPLRSDAFFEIGVFLSYDTAGKNDLLEMCLYRGEYLVKSGFVKEDAYTVLSDGASVIAVYGLTEAEREDVAALLTAG